MRTYRLTITSQDLSTVTITDSPTQWAGFTTIKALRGSTTPLLIPRGNESYIIEQFGPPSASNPDVQEAIDFNRQHALYISAPAGVEDVAAGLENNHGALYIASEGIYPGYVKATDISAGPLRNVPFSMAAAWTPGNTAFAADTADVYPSYFMKLQYTSTSTTPAVLNEGSIVTATLTNAAGTASERVQAIVGEAWDAAVAAAADLTLTEIDPGTVPYPVHFLRKYEDGVSGQIIGAAWLNSEGPTPVTHFKWYVAFAGDDPSTDIQTSVYGDGTPGDTMYVANAFFLSFTAVDPPGTGTGSKSRVSATYLGQISALALFYQKFPTATRTQITLRKVPKHDELTTNVFTSIVTDWPSRNISIAPREYIVSLDEEQKDGYNTSQYLEDVITTDRVIGVKYLADEPVQLTDIPSIQALAGPGTTFDLTGTRVVDSLSYDYAPHYADIASAMDAGWEVAKASQYDGLAVFFEPRGLVELNSTMVDIRTTHQFSRVVQPAGRGMTTVEALLASRSTYANNHGLAYPINEVLTRDPRTGTAWWRFPVGAYCSNLVNIMRQRNGAWAPMFQNENGLGGQIDATFEEIRFKGIDLESQRDLDESGFNTLLFDPDLGLIMVNQRTGQNPGTISDSSWLAHDMSFDLFKRRVHREVQFPQLGKPIDAQYIGVRTRQLQQIAAQFGNAFNAVQIEVDSLNTAETRAQRRFQMATSVQVTPFSEFVDFYFYNVGQTASVEDPFAAL